MAIRVMDLETLLPAASERTESAIPMDEEAFRGFYDRNARAVWAYLAKLTGSPQVADDLLQEAFYRFIRAGAQHESEAHRRNSLYLIATNLARDWVRRGRRVTTVPLDEEVFVPGAAPARPEERADLGRAMQRMSPSEREMLWLAYGQGSSHEEIAKALGLARASVKQLLFRARRKLAGHLRGERR